MPKTFSCVCALVLLAPLLCPADSIGLTSLTSDASNGDFNAYLATHSYDGTSFFLNTDTGSMIAGEYNSSYGSIFGYQLPGITPTTVATANGTVNVFNFSSFSLPQGDSLTLYGNSPAAILANGTVTIAGDLEVWSNAGAAGTGGGSGFGYQPPATGGGGSGGGGAGGYGTGYRGANDYGTAGSGGGGGMFTAGGDGTSGNVGAGGAGGASVNLSILQGGGGGGGGGGCGAYCSDGGRNGGQGGGAVFFGTTGDFMVTSTGTIAANGWGGQSDVYTASGAGGGGAGGDLWFGVTGTWANYGIVTAVGAAGGYIGGTYPSLAGSGAGGYVNIDPASIINDGTIDVANGLGGDGGLVTFDGPLSGTGSVEGDVAPEPGTVLLALIGITGLLLARWRRA